MEGFPLSEILDLGVSAILIVFLRELWNQNKATDERLFRYLEEARKDRHDLRAQLTAQALRAGFPDKPKNDDLPPLS